MGKNILIFSDGTGQAGGLMPDEKRTNVYKLYRATRCGPDTPGGKPITVWRRLYNLASQATGLGLTRNIIDCYAAIIAMWQPGDRIYLFGFSRGAYTARCVGGVLALCGVPRTEAGQRIAIDPASAERIAREAVETIYQHGASKKQQRFRDQRSELAALFRQKYGCDDNGQSNTVPYFIGVWDTVAALGASRTKTVLVSIAALVVAWIVCSLAAWGLSFVTPLPYGATRLALLAALIAGMAIWYLWTHLKWTTRTSFPVWQTIHMIAWRLKFYDKNLNERVAYARHALSIDEHRKDFRRVEWTNASGVASKAAHAGNWFEQIWFAGNHADIGGGYAENESRLSDVALTWMVDEALRLPQPILVDSSYLAMYPSPAGMQHDETQVPIGGLGFLNWEVAIRNLPFGAYLHASVFDRKALAEVQTFGRFERYDPSNLAGRDDFHRYDPRPAPSLPPKPHTADGDGEET